MSPGEPLRRIGEMLAQRYHERRPRGTARGLHFYLLNTLAWEVAPEYFDLVEAAAVARWRELHPSVAEDLDDTKESE